MKYIIILNLLIFTELEAQIVVPKTKEVSCFSNGDIITCSFTLENNSKVDTLYVVTPNIDDLKSSCENYFLSRAYKNDNVYCFFYEPASVSHGKKVILPKFKYLVVYPNSEVKFDFNIFKMKGTSNYYFFLKYSFELSRFDKESTDFNKFYDLVVKCQIK